MLQVKVRGGIASASRELLLFLFSAAVLWTTPSLAQLPTGYRPVEEPGIYGVRIHPSALAPNRRKWYIPPYVIG